MTKEYSNSEIVKRGGGVGSSLTFCIAFPTIFAAFLTSLDVGSTLSAFVVALMISLILAVFGYLWGSEAARCPTVKAAFFWGAKLASLVFGGLIVVPSLFSYLYVKIEIPVLHLVFLGALLFIVIISTIGSLVSGLTAIYIRDFIRFKRKRLIPQFTLQEMFAVTTLIAIIFSSISCAALLRQ
jgi:hypothetical protein